MRGLVHSRQKIIQQRYCISVYKIVIKVNGCGQTDLRSECLRKLHFLYENKRQNKMKKCLFSKITTITTMFPEF